VSAPKPGPLDVECPKCKEPMGRGCLSKDFGYGPRPVRPHAERLDAFDVEQQGIRRARQRVRRAASPLPGGKEPK